MENNDEAVLQLISQSKQQLPFWQLYLCTALAAANAELCTYPLDVTKTRQQIQGEVAGEGKRPVSQRYMYRMIYNIAKEGGIRSLYGGFTAMILRCFSYNAMRVNIYTSVRQQMVVVNEEGKEELPIIQAALCGSFAAVFSQFLCNPFDLCKVRLQMEGRRKLMGLPPRITSVPSAIRDIYIRNGIRGLWRGVVPSCLRAFCMSDTVVYDVSKRKIMQFTQWPDGRIIQFLSSISAGLAASILSTPADVVKSRIMNQPVDEKGVGLHYKSTLDCVGKLIKGEGILAIYKGFLPYWIRMGPWSLVFWTSIEELRGLMGAKGF